MREIHFFNYTGRPEAPKDFIYEANSVTNNSVKLLWRQGQNGGYNQTFVLCWHSDGEKEKIVKISESEEDEREYILSELSESKLYTVTIFAENRVGKSKVTNPIHITTLG